MNFIVFTKEFLGGKSAGHTIFAKYFYKMYFTFRVVSMGRHFVCDIVISRDQNVHLDWRKVMYITLCALLLCIV